MDKRVVVVAVVVVAVILFFVLKSKDSKMPNEKFYDISGYKWVTSGTCGSNNLKYLDEGECRNYLNESNYKVTNADHGPPGCWLVFGNELKNVNKNPLNRKKGFGCWAKSDVNDGKQCSPEIPCVCKSE